MKGLKQDLVGFHWSAFFEPRLPFTGVTVKISTWKIPLPHLLCSHAVYLRPHPPPPPTPPLSSTAHHPVSTWNDDTSPHSPFHLFCPLMTPDPVTFRHQGGCRLPPHLHLHLHPPSADINAFLSICKTLRGLFFYLPIFKGVGDKMEGFLHCTLSYSVVPVISFRSDTSRKQ